MTISGGKTIPFHSLVGNIEFKNVTFTYPTRPNQVSLCRAAKLTLLNFLSLFRDLQKPTRFSGGPGGVAAECFRHLQQPTRFSGGGGSSRIFPCSPDADARFGGGGGGSSKIYP